METTPGKESVGGGTKFCRTGHASQTATSTSNKADEGQWPGTVWIQQPRSAYVRASAAQLASSKCAGCLAFLRAPTTMCLMRYGGLPVQGLYCHLNYWSSCKLGCLRSVLILLQC